jgi:hypothetical protein
MALAGMAIMGGVGEVILLERCDDGGSGLGWQFCRHVGDMSARQPNVGTFGGHGPVVPTQN